MPVFLKGLLMALLGICLFCDMPRAMAAAEKILFIPHDDRPISYSQTVEVIREAGYEMIFLHDRQLLPRLWAYSGWNTPTNSTGFALGTGMLARKMTEEGRQRLLAVRYLDDWAYQANVRTVVGKEFIENFNDPSYYLQLRDKQDFAERRNTELMREFAAKNLPHFSCLQHFTVKNPWKRMFECSITFEE